MNDFLARLKQRKLVQWAIAYVAAAFALLQGIDIVGQQFGWPESVRRGITLALVVGFFVTLVIAWYHGERGAQRVSGTELLIIGLVLALGGGFLWRFAAGSRTPDNKPSASPNETKTTEPAIAIPEKSIAVLPFENLSEEKANAFFALGIQDEILTRLAKIADLKVISRTSTSHYASSPQNLPEIARQLGVANILEGSVQRARDAVHVNVQLIRAATDEHLWAESYDRKLDDIFGVEGEVAGAIAEQLDAKLSGSEKQQLNAKPTTNPEAYDAYLRGVVFEGGIEDFSHSVPNSIREFENAVRLDPGFALAWAHLCRQQALIFLNLDQSPQLRDAIRHALEMAIKLGPTLPETKLAEGFYHYAVERDYEEARKHYEAVRAVSPNNSLAIELLGSVARRQGHWDESRAFYERAIALDPQNVFLLTDAALGDLARRDVSTAQRHLGRARDLNPQNTTVLSFLAESFQLSGDISRAQTFLDVLPPARGDAILVNVTVGNAILLRKYDSAIAMMKTQLEKPDELGTFLYFYENFFGDLQRHAGDTAAATEAYEIAKHVLEEALHTQPDNADRLSALAWTETYLGHKDAALQHVRQAMTLLPSSKDAVVGPAYEDTLARIEAHFGDKESAITALRHLLSINYAAPPVTPALLRIDPDWDNLRGDPRFEKLCQEPGK